MLWFSVVKVAIIHEMIFFPMTNLQRMESKNTITDIVFFRNCYAFYQKELFDSITPQIAEIRTVAKSLPLFLKRSAKIYSSNGCVKPLKI